MKTYYIHTLDKFPAQFQSGMILKLPSNASVLSRKTLAQIRKEQKASKDARKALGWDIPKYGCLKVQVAE